MRRVDASRFQKAAALWASWLTLIIATGAWAQSAPMPKLGTYSGPNPDAMPKGPTVQNGEGLYWSIDDIKRTFGASNEVTMGNYAWMPIFRLSIVQRPYRDPAAAEAEMHEDKTHVYVIVSGTGTQLLGGTPAKDVVAPEGQHSATGPLAGAKSYRIKPGDLLVIPAMTWHQTLPDQGQTLNYQMVQIETRTRMP